jgi:hypothetical protein
MGASWTNPDGCELFDYEYELNGKRGEGEKGRSGEVEKGRSGDATS